MNRVNSQKKSKRRVTGSWPMKHFSACTSKAFYVEITLRATFVESAYIKMTIIINNDGRMALSNDCKTLNYTLDSIYAYTGLSIY